MIKDRAHERAHSGGLTGLFLALGVCSASADPTDAMNSLMEACGQPHLSVDQRASQLEVSGWEKVESDEFENAINVIGDASIFQNIMSEGSEIIDIARTRGRTGIGSKIKRPSSDYFHSSTYRWNGGESGYVNVFAKARAGKWQFVHCTGGVRAEEFSPELVKLVGETAPIDSIGLQAMQDSRRFEKIEGPDGNIDMFIWTQGFELEDVAQKYGEQLEANVSLFISVRSTH